MENLNNKLTIGILGGMGPVATAYFYKKIIEYAQKKHNLFEDYEFPKILIYNLPLFGLTEEGINKKNISLARKQLQEAAKSLEKTGADFLVIPCNTVHYFISDIEKEISIPIIDIREEVAKKIAKSGLEKIGICATNSSVNWNIFEKNFNYFGIKTYFPEKKERKIVSSVIMRVSKNLNDNKDKIALEKIALSFKKKGMKGMLLGCTELPIALDYKNIGDFSIFNSSSILAEAAIDYSITKKIKI